MKLRVYNNKLKKYVDDLVAINYCDGEPKAVKWGNESYQWENQIIDDDGTAWMILERCTGLIDKNGSDIYEGDKVSFYAKGWLEEGDLKEAIGIVNWDDENLMWQILVNGNPISNLCRTKDDKQFEIIGNIHE